jgi:hypothetical protein
VRARLCSGIHKQVLGSDIALGACSDISMEARRAAQTGVSGGDSRPEPRRCSSVFCAWMCIMSVTHSLTQLGCGSRIGTRITKSGVWVLLPAGKIARTKQLSDDVCEDSIIELGMTRNTCLFAASEEYPRWMTRGFSRHRSAFCFVCHKSSLLLFSADVTSAGCDLSVSVGARACCFADVARRETGSSGAYPVSRFENLPLYMNKSRCTWHLPRHPAQRPRAAVLAHYSSTAGNRYSAAAFARYFRDQSDSFFHKTECTETRTSVPPFRQRAL